MSQNKLLKNLATAVIAVSAVILAACASIGRPEGGPRDYTPPHFVRSTPAPGATNVTPKRMELFFDENVELDDAFNKVIVSPASKSTPVVRALGRRVTVEFRDTLAANTTYTIDFGDAIKDLNEGNILDGFALDFSTGSDIDTLRISGMVFEARTLEPAQGITVAVTTNLSDTALTNVPMERIARTNQLGQFTVRNLKPGKYRVYAVNDVNRDRLWDRSEDVAFYDHIVVPSSEQIMVTDTLQSKEGNDSIVSRQATRFTPDDVVLMWFNEDFKSQYIKDHQRPDRRRIVINMGTRSDSLPRININSGDYAGRRIDEFSLLAANPTRDSLTYWITDPKLLAADTISLAIEHLATDSLSQLVWKTDTIPFIYKAPKENKKKDKDKDTAKSDSVPAVQAIGIQVLSSGSQDLSRPLSFRMSEPIATIDTAMWTFEKLVDTTWTALDMPKIIPIDELPLTDRRIYYDWEPGAKYRLSVDSAAIMSVYGTPSAKLKTELSVKRLDEYANLSFTMTPVDSLPMMVELLDPNDKAVRTARVDEKNRATFKLVTPGKYYARVFFDRNGDGIWTTGNVADSLQAEETAYYPKKIELRANWDNELEWDPYQIALDQQKPYDIKKNRPKLKKGEQAPVSEDEEVDEWGNPINGARRNDGGMFSPGGFGGLGGGRQQSSGTTSNSLRDNRR